MTSAPESSPVSRRSRLIAVAVASTVVVAVGAVIGVGRAGSDTAASPQLQPSTRTIVLGEGGDTVAVSFTDLQALAATRTAALKSGDRTAFLSAVDPKLRKQQGQLFDNLRKVDFTVGDYVPFDQQGRATDRFGRGVTLAVDVAFRHQIAGFDDQPVEEWYRWTVVKKDAASPLTITDVTAAPARAMGDSDSVMYPAPWDVWTDMRVVTTDHTMILADAPMAGKARKVAAVAEQSARTVLSSWAAAKVPGRAFDRFVTVLVPDTRQLTAMYQVVDGESEEAGRMMPMPVAGLDSQTGGTRTVIDTSSSFFTGDNIGEIFRHEYAHAVIEGMSTTDHPDAGPTTGLQTWVIEGFAEYLANLGGTDAGRRAPAGEARIRAGFDGKLPPPGDWYGSEPREVSHYYYLSHQAFRYMAQQYGSAEAIGLAAAYYQGGATLDQILQRELGVTLTAFEQSWAAFVRTDAR